MYKGPDDSEVVIKLVKEQEIPSFPDSQASNSQDSTILYSRVHSKKVQA